jgi:cobalt-zinc-cadmium efflux system protein
MHSHAHTGSHCHHGGTGRILKWSTAATIVFVVVEVIAGFRAGSLALLSDAGHNLTDALALLFTWFAFYLQSKPANNVKTYGYHRTGVLAAFVNALTLVALSVWIFYESIQRLMRPEPVQETIMLWVAALGLLLNGGIMWGLRAASKNDLNVRSAFVHMLGDALGSVAIMAGAIAIHYTGWQRIDPALSLLIGALIVWTAWDIVNESLNILLEGLPRGLELQIVISAMQEVPGVLDVHDLHIWSLGSSTHALSCHALIEDVPPSASDRILQKLNTMLCDRFAIRHTTVQFEHVGCVMSESGCVLPSGSHAHHQH